MDQFAAIADLLRTVARALGKMAQADGGSTVIFEAVHEINSAAAKVEGHVGDSAAAMESTPRN